MISEINTEKNDNSCGSYILHEIENKLPRAESAEATGGPIHTKVALFMTVQNKSTQVDHSFRRNGNVRKTLLTMTTSFDIVR